MQEQSPEDIEELLDELEKEYDTKAALPPEVENLLQNLQPRNRYASRRRAAEQLGKLSESNLRIVQSLVAAGESDAGGAIKRAVLKSLRAPAHQEVLQENPELTERADSIARQIAAEGRWLKFGATVALGIMGAGVGAGLFWLVVLVARYVIALVVVVADLVNEGQWVGSGIPDEPVVIVTVQTVIAPLVGAVAGAIAGVTTVLVDRDWRWKRMGSGEAFASGQSRDTTVWMLVFLAAVAVVIAFAEVYWVLGQLAVRAVARAIRKLWQSRGERKS